MSVIIPALDVRSIDMPAESPPLPTRAEVLAALTLAWRDLGALLVAVPEDLDEDAVLPAHRLAMGLREQIGRCASACGLHRVRR